MFFQWLFCWITQGWDAYVLLGGNRQCILSTHILVLQDDELHWYTYMSQGSAIIKIHSFLASTVRDV